MDYRMSLSEIPANGGYPLNALESTESLRNYLYRILAGRSERSTPRVSEDSAADCSTERTLSVQDSVRLVFACREAGRWRPRGALPVLLGKLALFAAEWVIASIVTRLPRNCKDDVTQSPARSSLPPEQPKRHAAHEGAGAHRSSQKTTSSCSLLVPGLG